LAYTLLYGSGRWNTNLKKKQLEQTEASELGFLRPVEGFQKYTKAGMLIFIRN
jgi:hypothetical protein